MAFASSSASASAPPTAANARTRRSRRADHRALGAYRALHRHQKRVRRVRAGWRRRGVREGRAYEGSRPARRGGDGSAVRRVGGSVPGGGSVQGLVARRIFRRTCIFKPGARRGRVAASALVARAPVADLEGGHGGPRFGEVVVGSRHGSVRGPGFEVGFEGPYRRDTRVLVPSSRLKKKNRKKSGKQKKTH